MESGQGSVDQALKLAVFGRSSGVKPYYPLLRPNLHRNPMKRYLARPFIERGACCVIRLRRKFLSRAAFAIRLHRSKQLKYF